MGSGSDREQKPESVLIQRFEAYPGKDLTDPSPADLSSDSSHAPQI